MTKKLITFSGILAMALSFGLIVDVGAAYNDVLFAVDTPLGVQDLVVKAGSQVESLVIDTGSQATITFASTTGVGSSSITITSAAGHIMAIDGVSTTNHCDQYGASSITIPYALADLVEVLTVSGTCTAAKAVVPTVSGVKVGSKTTLIVTMSEPITYDGATAWADLMAGTTFAGVAPTSRSGDPDGSSTSFTLIFDSGDLTGAGVTDVSKLIMPADVLENAHGDHFAGLVAGSNQYVTDLASINQLYDFTFAIQPGKNFMSVPFTVAAASTLVASYTDPTSSTTISIQTKGDDGAIFKTVANADVPTPTSFDPLYGYYIISSAPSDVYLRLNKHATQSPTFDRTFSATGWHFIGVASNHVDNSLGADTDDDLLYANLGYYGHYTKVVDIAVGLSDDTNAAGSAVTNPTYDGMTGVYKAKLDDRYVVSKTMLQIDDFDLSLTAVNDGIEFNHGESYFIWINTLYAKYIGEQVSTANLYK